MLYMWCVVLLRVCVLLCLRVFVLCICFVLCVCVCVVCCVYVCCGDPVLFVLFVVVGLSCLLLDMFICFV